MFHTNTHSLLNKPCIVGYMSVDQAREYHSNLSQLKFLNEIPKGNIAMDLNHNILNAVKRTTDENNEKIDLLLKFLLDQRNHVKFDDNEISFISYRRTLIKVMTSAYSNDRSCIIASLFKNSIYLCTLDTQEEIERRLSQTDEEKKFCAWGYKFEQYILSDLPNVHPDINRPVIENEEFSLYYSTALGNHKLFYGAQIDGLLATDNFTEDPPKTNDVETILNYLRKKQYVELKTNRLIQSPKQDRNFKRYKLLRCWCQCYLAGLKGLLVGYRDDHGTVKHIQWFQTEQLISYCKNEWNPQIAINFLNKFLTYVKNSFQPYQGNAEKENKPITLLFEIKNKIFSVKEIANEENIILPDWYINATH